MESNKICSKCGKNKPIFEFKDRLSFCKSCYNAQQRSRRAEKQQPVSESMSALLSKAKELVSCVENCNKTGYNPEILNILCDLNLIAQRAKDDGKTLSFTLQISDVMNNYIKKSYLRGHALDKALSILMNDNIISEFEKTFEMPRQSVLDHRNELDNIVIFINAIKVGYGVLIEEANIINDNKFMNDPQFITCPSAEYDFTNKTLRATSNPLNLTAVEFLNKMFANEHWGLRYYKSTGYWEMLRSMLDL